MQFEDFDKKIKEAADNHHPAYDEQAWAKMNKLLDKHMPEKEERRRRFAWLFFLLFLVGGAGIFYGVQSLVTKETTSKTVKGSDTEVTIRDGAEMKDELKKKNMVGTPVDTKSEDVAGADQPVISTGNQVKTKPAADDLVPVESKGNKPGDVLNRSTTAVAPKNKAAKRTAPGDRQGVVNRTPDFQSGVAKKKRKTTDTPITNAAINTDRRDILKDNAAIPDKSIPVPDSKTITPDAVISVTPVTGKKDDTAAVVSNLKTKEDADLQRKKKAATKKKSRFYLTLSAGPDASFTNDGKPGRIVPVTGAGLGYTFRERISVRAGFYNAAKVYTASPDAYHAPANFYNYYPYLVKVDANCRIYEIPVSLGYHFGARKNHSWFASATLSSYLMKRETYNYSYKTSAWGSVQQRAWTFNNRNQHLFSVLGISGGYQRKITERISFIAEPYLRMPMNGVGYGKVKLNSAGVLFSIAIQPAAFIPHKQKK